MDVVLHEGHQHSESASAVGPETMLLLTIGLLVVGAIAAYAAVRYTS